MENALVTLVSIDYRAQRTRNLCEPIPTCLCLTERQYVDGFGELAGPIISITNHQACRYRGSRAVVFPRSRGGAAYGGCRLSGGVG